MKRSTLVVAVIFLALAGLTFYLNKTKPATDTTNVTPSPAAEFLLSESDGLPSSIDIKDNTDKQVVLARNEAGVWVLKQPIATEADQASAEEAASQVKALRIVSKLELDPADVGLTQPSYTLIVETTSGTKKTVRIGDLTPTGSGYYANIDGSNQTLVIGKTGLDALLTLLDSPPYATPTATNTP